MELLHIEFLGRSLRLEGSMAGWQQLFWDNTLVSQIDASDDESGVTRHQFTLSAGEEVLHCQLDCELNWQPFDFSYQVSVNDVPVTEGGRNEKDIERQVPVEAPPAEKRFSLIGLVSLGMKALKSAKVIK
ncbi:site-2 protease family protein, partial [Vibrio astriarenae]